MDGQSEILKIGLSERPSTGAGQAAQTGLDVNRMNSRKASEIEDWTAMVTERSGMGMLRPNGATQAPNNQDQHPEQDRAFMIAPDAGDAEDHRLIGMAVLIDVLARRKSEET
jgi:hypothetical protein